MIYRETDNPKRESHALSHEVQSGSPCFLNSRWSLSAAKPHLSPNLVSSLKHYMCNQLGMAKISLSKVLATDDFNRM